MSDEKLHAASANGGAAPLEGAEIDVRVDDDMTDPTPPVKAVEATSGDGKAGDGKAVDAKPIVDPKTDFEAETTKTKRSRPKMSLRIPDDEVARPSERAPALTNGSSEEAPISTPRPAIAPTRIIAINPPSIPAPVEPSFPSLPELPPTDADKTVELKALSPDAAALAAAADDAMHEAPTRHDLSDLDAPDSVDSSDRLTPEPQTRPSPQIESELASSSDLTSDHSAPAAMAAGAAAAVAHAPLLEDSDPGARTQESESAKSLPLPDDSDGVDVDVDSDSAPPPTSDEAEVIADDLMSIESMPLPPKAPSVPPMLAAKPSGETAAVSKEKPIEAAPPIAVVPPSAPAATSAPQNGGVLATPAAAAAQAALADPNKKRLRTWWEDLFNDDFVRTMAKINDSQIAREAKFIEESLGVAGGAALLDLACGTGLHAIELTKRGYQVVGFDLSLAMLARAADEAQERNTKINFVQGDMREMGFDALFDGVYSWNTSFGYFDEEKNAEVLRRVHRALKKGGQFLLDVVNRDYIIKQSPSLAWFEGDGCICMDEMQLDFITSRLRVKRTMMMDDGRSRETEYSMRAYSLHELGKLLHEQGFRVAEVSGRVATPGVFFGNEAPRIIVLAEKR